MSFNRNRRGPSGSFGGPGRSFKNNNRRGAGSKKRTGEYINPAKFVQAAKPSTQTEYVAQNSFDDFAI
nr:hypothetical protein [Candidatus Saccharibacteria bacterium]